MQIKIEIDGELKTFVMPFIKGRVLRRAIGIQEAVSQSKDTISLNLMDEMIEFVCNAFGNQFSPDDIWDGIEAQKILPTVSNVIIAVSGTMGKS